MKDSEPGPRISKAGAGTLLGRRDLLRGSAALSAAIVTGTAASGRTLSAPARSRTEAGRGGRVKQDLVSWTYMNFGDHWSLDQLCRAAVELGCRGIELVGPEEWPTMQEYGLVCAMSTNGMPDPPFVKGLNNPRYRDEVVSRTKERIEACAAAGVPSVIAFTGFKYLDVEHPEKGEISSEEGARNTVEALEELARHAERHGVDVCLEHLNSRVADDDFRGHPGYQGDDVDYCADIVRRVGSPRVKLLFDVYHVQIMNGDVISRIREYGPELIGHIHTAGVPGRVELDARQELNYPAVVEALVEVGYDGYVGHEFIPTRDPMDGLRRAVSLCDV